MHPATFQTLMNSILRPYIIDKFVLVYLDDILVYSNSEEEHREHLRLVFETLREHRLYAKPSKCTFSQPTVEFCGHIVGQGVVRVLPSKVKVIQDWPKPRTVHEIRQFYGLVNYYRRFISLFLEILVHTNIEVYFVAADKVHNFPPVLKRPLMTLSAPGNTPVSDFLTLSGPVASERPNFNS
jgi:Reverse transcriptase (RNA-dependent DNA polymerase)